MTAGPSVLLLEFNELSPDLMRQWMEQGRLPNFRRLYSESSVYMTTAEEQPPNLEPWIQWVSVHSGLSYREHKVFHLGDGHKLQTPRVWDILSDAGYRVWICGSMNTRYSPDLNGALLPDPWAQNLMPRPPSLMPYFRFVRRHVMDHTKEAVPMSLSDYLSFTAFATTHGLSAKTACAIAAQLALETMGRRRWKRAVILDKLQFDLFRWYWRTTNPHFATFFLNSTAHFQHMYWRNMAPSHFTIQPTADEQAEYADAILFGYQEMDNLLARFLQLVGPQTTVIFCTALSQQPCLRYEEQGGKVFYRPRDFSAVLEFAGIHPQLVSPVMSEQFHLIFSGKEEARDAVERLTALRVDGRQAMIAQLDGSTVFCGCQIFEHLPSDARIATNNGQHEHRFFDLFYQAEGMKSGMHHPDGMLWIRQPERTHSVHPGKVSLTSIAPTILDIFSVSRPAWMEAESLFAKAQRDPKTTVRPGMAQTRG